jgi:glyoxylase-like metal-dependent hydrolase (beta-lactamase superfamily II)
VFDELGDGVFRRRYESMDLNVGVVVSEQGILVVDTRCTHVEADELLADIRTLSPLPVRWVVDTHWHWDHTFGNSRFTGAEIWGHDLCRRALEERGESMKQAAAEWLPDLTDDIESVVIAAPSRSFADTASIDLGSRTVLLSYHGLGHTDSDIAISVEGEDVLFLGDLVEESGPPHFDDGYPIHWPGTLRSALHPGKAVIVPGHGDTMSRAEADEQLEELESVALLARECVLSGVPVSQAAARGPYPVEVMASALTRAVELGL